MKPDESLRFEIEKLRSELDRLKSLAPSARDINGVEREIELLRNSVGEAKAMIKDTLAISERVIELRSMVDKLAKSVDTLEHKFPPIPAIYAAIAITISTLGFGYVDLRRIGAPIQQASVVVTNSASQLTAVTDAVRIQMGQWTTNFNSMTSTLEGASKKLAGFDKALAMMISEVSVARPTSSSISSTIRQGTEDGITLFENSLMQMQGGADSAPIRLLIEARRAQKDGDYDKAIELAQKAKKSDPNDTTGVYDFFTGSVYGEQRMHREAIAFYKKVVDKDPSSAYNNIGSQYYSLAMETKEPEERMAFLGKSRESLEDALRSDPKNSTAAVNLSVTLASMKQYDEALKSLEDFAGDKDTAAFSHQLGAINCLLGRNAEAMANIARAIQFDKSIAIRIAIDSDFTGLREDQGFTELLRNAVGPQVFAAIQKTWNDEKNK